MPTPDDGLLVESPPDTWEEAELNEAVDSIAAERPAAEITPEERSRLVAEAFAEGGEAAVMELMERLGQSL